MKPYKALLINPYIYDFAAYSFWATPLGLLYIGSILRKNGFELTLLDCLQVVEEKRKEDGRAPFYKERVDLPPALTGIKKRLKRYGFSKEVLIERLSSIETPDIVLITSIMTYWYMGAKEVLDTVKQIFPQSRVIVGGIYPTLCYEHALMSMKAADLIVKNTEIKKFYDFIEDEFSIELNYKPELYGFKDVPYPCLDLYDNLSFVPLLTSYGCVYRCTYCATPYMYPKIIRRDPEDVLTEAGYWQKLGVCRFVIYDDNLLYQKNNYAKPILKGLADMPSPVSIYNPNAINAALIDSEIAELLMMAGFKEVRIGLETVNPEVQKNTGDKVNLQVFERGIDCLRKAGFRGDSIGVYILAGLPFQQWIDVKDAIDYLSDLGVRAQIAEYTPIPHTPLFDKYSAYARYPIADDPLYQNNALFPFCWEGFTEDRLMFLKHYAREKNGLIAP